VLVDSWTYTCVNCIRTMPHLKDWHAKYASKGLVIVGVHSPEFEFEMLTEDVTQNVQDFGLEYPIARDNDFKTWRPFHNRFWPAKYLVDAEDTIRYNHFGVGTYDETESQIRQLLVQASADLSGIPEGLPAEESKITELGSYRQVTRELYGGTRRNRQYDGGYAGRSSTTRAENRPSSTMIV